MVDLYLEAMLNRPETTEEETSETAADKVLRLQAEVLEIDRFLSESVKKAEARRREIVGWAGGIGELEQARIQARDEQFPIYDQVYDGGWVNRRIASVDKTWITMRQDGIRDRDLRQGYRTWAFKLATGWRKGARDDNGAIDPARALAIWEAHGG